WPAAAGGRVLHTRAFVRRRPTRSPTFAGPRWSGSRKPRPVHKTLSGLSAEPGLPASCAALNANPACCRGALETANTKECFLHQCSLLALLRTDARRNGLLKAPCLGYPS